MILNSRSAVLWTGKRSIVYVKQPGTMNRFLKFVRLSLARCLEINMLLQMALKEGEEIVTQRSFQC